MSMAHILDLPDELLLEIGSYFDERYRNRDLANLSLVCRRFRGVAQEKLICQPSFHLTHIHSYMWELECRDNLIPRVKSLEIFSSSDDRSTEPAVSLPGQSLTIPGLRIPQESIYPSLRYQPSDFANKDGMIEKCKEVIRYYAREENLAMHKVLWLTALDLDVIPALVAVLLCILPNLKVLKLGTTWLMDFPIFSCLTLAPKNIFEPLRWCIDHQWMVSIADILKTKLHALEFPADFTDMDFELETALFSFRGFSKLKYISVPWYILFWYDQRRWPGPPADPRTIFPKTLELLRISECRETTANFLNELCMWKKRGYFSNLRCIELYFKWDARKVLAHCIARRCPSIKDMQIMCKDAEIALSLFWPPNNHTMFTHMMRKTPWKLLEERALCCGWCQKAPHDDCWDANGDSIMLGEEYVMMRGLPGIHMGHNHTKC